MERPSVIRRAVGLGSFLLVIVFMCVPCGTSQQRRLTLGQIEELIQISTPDSVVADEIRSRGLDFTPTATIVEVLQKRGAGHATLAAMRERMPIGTVEVDAALGSQVTLDGTDRGTTDSHGRLVLLDLPTGPHQLLVTRANYKSGESSFTLAAHEYKRLSIQLDWAGGYLTVRVTPPDSTIQVGGLGQYTGAIYNVQCAPGTYDITVTHAGLKTESRSVVVSPGQYAALELRLSADPQLVAGLLQDADNLRSGGDFAGAVQKANEVLRLDPTNNPARESIYQSYVAGGNAAFKASNWWGAINYLHEATNFDPSKPDAWADLGLTDVVVGRASDQFSAWDNALRLGGNVPFTAWHELGVHYESGIFRMSTSQISFVNDKGVRAFATPPNEVKVVGAYTMQNQSYFRLQVARRNYNFDFVPVGVVCQVLMVVQCPPQGLAQQQTVANYVAQTIPKLASGALSPTVKTTASNAVSSSSSSVEQPAMFSRSTLGMRGFVFDDQLRGMCPIQGPDGPCRVEAFVGGESRDDRSGYTCSKLDRGSYMGHCVGGALEGISVVIADGTTKAHREAFLSYFSEGRIAYPALTSWLDSSLPDFFGLLEKNGAGHLVSYGCVVFGRWDNSRTQGDCPKLMDIYGPDIFAESNVQRLRDGTFDLSHYTAKFVEYVQGR